MIKFAICDDEPVMARELAEHLANYMEEKQIAAYSVSSFSNGHALLEAGSFDIIFLDIQMDQPDGMETARLLRQQGSRSLLVFVTVLKECVFDAFQVEAYDYLLKPLDSARFGRTMDRALRSLRRKCPCFCPLPAELTILTFACSSPTRWTTIHTGSSTPHSRSSLNPPPYRQSDCRLLRL